jgi:hypothetical protein
MEWGGRFDGKTWDGGGEYWVKRVYGEDLRWEKRVRE